MGEPQIRVSDAERNAIVASLRTHCADGRLTLDEFAERVEVALSARTQAELNLVTSDLPAVLPTATSATPQARTREPLRTTIAIMSGSERKGRWRLEGEHTAFALMGGVELDLRNAEIVGDEVTINAIAIMGGVEIIVPEGIDVDLSGVAIMGGKSSRLKGHTVLPGSPLVRVKAFAFWGGVEVKSRTSKEHHLDVAKRILGTIGAAGPPVPPPLHVPPMQVPMHPRARREQLRAERSSPGGGADRRRLPEGTVTVLVTDIEGSTEMAESLGDLRFRQVLARHDDMVLACVDQHQGSVVKGTGDGFLLAFSSARQALLCASELQHAFDDDEQLAIRMGVHSGEVVRADGDLYGKTVIVASRLAGAARGGEVLVSEITKALTESGGDLRFDTTREVTLKGLSGTQQAWTLDWST